MVMSFFRRSDESGLEHVAHQTISMLGDARHTFDLASTVVLGGADPNAVGDDIEATDRRINESEQRLRSELVVHVAVQGSADIGVVLGYILLLKKIERIGDQAKNIYELSGEGVSFAGADDVEEFVAQQQEISRMYVEAADLLATPDADAAEDFLARSLAVNDRCGEKVLEYMHSERPGSWAVPRAVLYRYWKRIVANLAGIVTSSIEPIQHIDYLDDGAVDLDDD
jgi:phosphate transport system protein